MKISARIRFRLGFLMSICLLLSSNLLRQVQDYKSTSIAGGDADNKSANDSGLKAHDDSFQIGADDVLAINVWKEPEISRSVPARSDGKLALPPVVEGQATGR